MLDIDDPADYGCEWLDQDAHVGDGLALVAIILAVVITLLLL